MNDERKRASASQRDFGFRSEYVGEKGKDTSKQRSDGKGMCEVGKDDLGLGCTTLKPHRFLDRETKRQGPGAGAIRSLP